MPKKNKEKEGEKTNLLGSSLVQIKSFNGSLLIQKTLLADGFSLHNAVRAASAAEAAICKPATVDKHAT